MTFNSLGLSDRVLKGVTAVGYVTPTEIQGKSIPPAIAGHDVIGRAETGSGKTAAFVLPILDRLAAGGHRTPGAVRSLILTPTRELAVQIEESAVSYSRFLKLRIGAFFGGVSINPQLDRMRHGMDVLVATPGRLLDHMERGSVDLSLCEFLVVDEADRMFDMGFIQDVRKIVSKVAKDRQTMLFSATMSKEVRALTAGIMRDPVVVEVGAERKPAETVRQHFYLVQKEQKLDLLFHLLGGKGLDSVLVFSRTKHGADKIHRKLQRSGIASAALHSNRSQIQRQKALDEFKRGRVRVLVATDIAARGIDVTGISHVINFDTPGMAEDYIHRIGRTGRATAEGDAITFVSNAEFPQLRKIENFVGRRYTLMQEEGVPVHQLPGEHRTPGAHTQRGDLRRHDDRSGRSENRSHRGGKPAGGFSKSAAEKRNGKANGGRDTFGSRSGEGQDSRRSDTRASQDTRGGKHFAEERRQKSTSGKDRAKDWRKRAEKGSGSRNDFGDDNRSFNADMPKGGGEKRVRRNDSMPEWAQKKRKSAAPLRFGPKR